MLEHFTPEDNEHDDSEFHKQVRVQSQETVNLPDDREFTITEIRNAIENMDNKKAPEGITGENFLTIEIFPKFITALYECLGRGVFQKRWKRAKLIPIVKPGKEDSEEVSKFRPISRLTLWVLSM